MTLTDQQYAEALAALKRGDRAYGTIHIDRWCDGSTACAVETEPHGHWRGGYAVDGTEVVLLLLKERELVTTEQVLRALRAENERLRALLDEGVSIVRDYSPGHDVWISAALAALNGKEKT